MAMFCNECGICDQFSAGTKQKGDVCPYPSKRIPVKTVKTVKSELEELTGKTFNESGSKYLRQVPCTINDRVDVYAVIDAFNVTCPARQHAIKKLLCTGIRGKGDALQDLKEARDAITRAIQMEEAKNK